MMLTSSPDGSHAPQHSSPLCRSSCGLAWHLGGAGCCPCRAPRQHLPHLLHATPSTRCARCSRAPGVQHGQTWPQTTRMMAAVVAMLQRRSLSSRMLQMARGMTTSGAPSRAGSRRSRSGCAHCASRAFLLGVGAVASLTCGEQSSLCLGAHSQSHGRQPHTTGTAACCAHTCQTGCEGRCCGVLPHADQAVSPPVLTPRPRTQP